MMSIPYTDKNVTLLINSLWDGNACLQFRPILADSVKFCVRKERKADLKGGGIEKNTLHGVQNIYNKMASNVKGKDNILGTCT